MKDPIFLSLDQVLYIQQTEAALTTSPILVRDQGGLDAALAAPQASFEGQYLMSLFEMAATYVSALAIHHPFLDANKRTAVGSALVFLSINGFIVLESRDEELADLVLDFLEKNASKNDLTQYFKEHAEPKKS
jgi:death on curing protein